MAHGRELRVDATVSVLRIDGEALLVVILRDLGEALRARRALADSQVQLEAAIAAMADGIVIADTTGRFIAFNDAFAHFHRFGSRYACPPTAADLAPVLEAFTLEGTPVHPGDWLLARALRGQSGSQESFLLRRKDTGERWYASYNYAPVRNADGTLGASTGLVARAHVVGLAVHPWTFRAENHFLPANLRSGADPRTHGDLAAEIRAFIAEGVDGLFADHPAVAVGVMRGE